MFERTVSFWKRLLGGKPAPETASLRPDERRVYIRYPADLGINYHKAGGSRELYRGRVRNISQGGISLQVERECQPGDLLGIELPGSGEQGSDVVLACVIHVRPAGPGQWLIGCTFARELTPEQLEPFGGTPTSRPFVDQRTRPRFTCDVEAIYQIVAVSEMQAWPAQVLNISATGIGLLVDREVLPGTLLSVDLTPRKSGTVKTMLSCVVHVGKQGDREWALGCNFITELSEKDLKELL